MPPGDVGRGVDDAVGQPGADRQHRAGPVAGADEHVLGPGRAVDEVPLPQRPLLALDEQQTAAGEHQEILLLVLAVVVAGHLAGLEHADVDADRREPRLTLEPGVGAEHARLPLRLGRVEHEPAVPRRNEPTLPDLEACFHPRILPALKGSDAP